MTERCNYGWIENPLIVEVCLDPAIALSDGLQSLKVSFPFKFIAFCGGFHRRMGQALVDSD